MSNGIDPVQIQKQDLDGVWVDNVRGIGGTTWPIGTPEMPVSNLTDAFAIAVARKTQVIRIASTGTNHNLPSDVTNRFVFIGYGSGSRINLNDHDPNSSEFWNLRITGDTGPAGGENIIAHDCAIVEVGNCTGYFYNCRFSDTLVPVGPLDILPARMFGVTIEADDLTAAYLIEVSGYLEIDNLVNGASEINIWANSLLLTINASCTAGTINIYGNGRVTNNAAGATVNDYTVDTPTAPVYGAVSDAGAAVTDFDTDLTEATNNHYNGGLLMFLTGANAKQAHLVDVYTGASKNCAFATSDQWTDAPANGDKFVIMPAPGAYLKKMFTNIAATAAGKTQHYTYHLTSAANAGDVTIATFTAQGCHLKSLGIRSNGATTADLTSVGIYAGAAKVNTLIDPAGQGMRANIAAEDQQVWWEGDLTLDATKTIVATLTGGGATAVDMDIDVEYFAEADGGYLA